MSLTSDAGNCIGYALHVDVETAAGTVLGVGLAADWRVVPVSGEYSCRAAYTATVTTQDIYKLHAENSGFSDMAVESTEIANGELPVLSGHLN